MHTEREREGGREGVRDRIVARKRERETHTYREREKRGGREGVRERIVTRKRERERE